MQRLVGLLMLAGCTCLVAGCGGSSLEAKARKVVGDPHATVVSAETVRGLNGEPLTIVVMKPSGSTGLGCGEALVSEVVSQTVAGSLVPGCPRSSDAFVELWGSKLADGGDIGISRFQVAAIAKARSLSPRFQKFPAVNQLTVRCAIGPAKARGRTQSGMCATIAEPFGKPVRCVAFSEAWRPSPGSRLSMRGWVVTFSRGGHVQSTYTTAYPPQPWAGGMTVVREPSCQPKVVAVHPTGGKHHSAYAYELPIDPNHPDNGQWSTFVRMRPVTAGYRIRGIFPREWVVVAVKPLARDGQQAAIRGWLGKKNPIWHGRLVLRLAD